MESTGLQPVEEGNSGTFESSAELLAGYLLVFKGKTFFEVIAVDACSSLIIIAVSSDSGRNVQTLSSPLFPTENTHGHTQIALVGCCDSSSCSVYT